MMKLRNKVNIKRKILKIKNTTKKISQRAKKMKVMKKKPKSLKMMRMNKNNNLMMKRLTMTHRMKMTIMRNLRITRKKTKAKVIRKINHKVKKL